VRRTVGARAAAWSLTLALGWSDLAFAQAPPVAADPPHAGPAAEPAAVEPAAVEPAAVEPSESPSAAFKIGEQLYAEGRFAEAADAFERSYRAEPSPNTLYNLAVSWEKAGEILAALDAFERYLGAGGLSAEDEEQTQAAIATLRLYVGELELRVGDQVHLSRIVVNGEEVRLGEFPYRSLPDAVELELFGPQGTVPKTLQIMLEAGRTKVVDVGAFHEPVAQPAEQPIAQPATQPGPTQRDDPRDERARYRRAMGVFWTGLALTGASGITLAIVGGITVRDKKAYREASDCRSDCPDPVAELDHINGTLVPATNTLIGVTAGFAAATLVAGIVAGRRRSRLKALSWTGPGLRLRW